MTILNLPISKRIVASKLDQSPQLCFTFHSAGYCPISVYTQVAYDEKLVRIPQIGEDIQDGWKYAGISATTNNPLWVAVRDQPYRKTWNEAIYELITLSDLFGFSTSRQKTEDQLLESMARGNYDHGGVRLPTACELDKNLYLNRDAIGNFNITISNPEGCYWSSKEINSDFARTQAFVDGRRDWSNKVSYHSVRLVCG